MKPVITKFNDKTGDFEITIPVPFILKDGIEYVDMMVADIPKYEDIKDYNVFDLIRENQELKKQLEEHNLALENLAYWKGKNESKMKINRLRKENQELKEQLEVGEQQYNDLVEEKEELQEQLSNSHQIKNKQKEFIDWLENEIKGCHNYSKYIENKLQELKSRSAGKTYIANEIMKNEVAKKCFTKILSKYKEIIGKDINVATKKDVK